MKPGVDGDGGNHARVPGIYRKILGQGAEIDTALQKALNHSDVEPVEPSAPEVAKPRKATSKATGAEQDRNALDLLIRGYQVSRMIRLVADLAIADKIAPSGQRTVESLAEECDVVPGPLLRILRALSSCRVFQTSREGLVEHSPLSLLLRTDTPSSLHHAARIWTTPGPWSAWGALDAALTGGTPHHAAWGMRRFEYLREHPDEARLFDAFMAHSPDDRHRAIAAAYDFSNAELIVDVGGGNGEALRMILARFPKPRGLVLDKEHVIEAITPEARLDGRIAAEGGSFFERVPPGGDLYLLNWVLHDWSDEDCGRILRTCRAAMKAHARLLIGELMLEPDPAVGDPAGYLIDVHMMVSFGEARERTEAEFRDLLATSGFAVERVILTASPFRSSRLFHAEILCVQQEFFDRLVTLSKKPVMSATAIFFSIPGALLIGAISPGPSFVLVSRIAMTASRLDGLAAALGMGLGGAIFGTLALVGLTALLLQVEWLYLILKIVGGAYLVYLGVRIWRGASEPIAASEKVSFHGKSRFRFFFLALLTHVSNPQAAVFYGSIFAALLPASPPIGLLLIHPPSIFVIEAGWYAAVALLFSSQRPRAIYLGSKNWIDRVAGAVMGALGTRLISECVLSPKT